MKAVLRTLMTLAVVLMAGEAFAQLGTDGLPPNRFHPFRGGTNCVQVSNSDGNFSCSPYVTIDPLTGQFNSVFGGPISRATTLVIAPSGNTLQALTNDLVIGKSTLVSVAPAGPGVGGVTFRVRQSPNIPGYCQVIAIAGTAFGTNLEFPVAFMNPAYSFLAARVGSASFPDYYVVDLPGGPSGC